MNGAERLLSRQTSASSSDAPSDEEGAMGATNDDEVRTIVGERYGKIAEQRGGCGCAPGCCGARASEMLGYLRNDLSAVPEGGNMGLACGNPQALASLRPGETGSISGTGAAWTVFSRPRRSVLPAA